MKTQSVTYQKLHQELKAKIRNGELTGKLPSIAEFTQQYGVSHNTVKKVLDQLKMQSFVYGHQGKGVFVNELMTEQQNAGSVMVFTGLGTLYNPFYLRVLTHLKPLLNTAGIMVDIVTDLNGVNLEKYDLMLVIQSLNQEVKEILQRQVGSEKLLMLNYHQEGSCHIGNDNRSGGYTAMEYLYRHGHRKIGVIARDLNMADNLFHDRHHGVLDFAQAHPDTAVTVCNMVSTRASEDEKTAQATTAELLEKAPDLTAIFAFTDVLALGTVSLLQRRHVRIPDDISLIGFDNRDFSGLLNPPLTTLEEPAAEIAQKTFEQIRQAIGGYPIQNTQIKIKPILIERASVKSITTGS